MSTIVTLPRAELAVVDVKEEKFMPCLLDYHAAVAGGLRLVPDDGALIKLAADYQHMVDDDLFLDEAESFDSLLQHCNTVQEKANAA